MKPTARKLRPALETHGGKSYLARRIIRHFPPHQVYVEPFAGGLSCLLNKPRSAREVAGDLDAELMGFCRVLVDRTPELLAAIGPLPYDRDTWMAIRAGRPDDELGRAVRTLVVNRWSRGGLGGDIAWSDRLRGGRPEDVNGWEMIKAELPRIADRLRGVELHCSDAADLIRSSDAQDALIYCDPPYVHATRTVRDAYRHEMTEADHRRLLGVLRECRGAVVLSGYASPLYDELHAGWDRVEIDMANHAGQGRAKQRRTEVLWLSPARPSLRCAEPPCTAGLAGP